ncbi:MAG: hypothetical protein ACO25K_06340 [Candidatus Fonsibacter ubiquis]
MNFYRKKPIIANKTAEYIDIKNIDKLVPKEYLAKINLLFNKDIIKEPKTPNELLIYRLSQLKESDMQQHFYKQAISLQQELKQLSKFNELEFVQNDNGDTSAGHLTAIQRIALFKRKKAEGSRKGFPDISIHYYVNKLTFRDTVFCEVKKIGAPSEIHITKEQLDWFLKLNSMSFDAYITNNPIFFKNVVLGNIKKDF